MNFDNITKCGKYDNAATLTISGDNRSLQYRGALDAADKFMVATELLTDGDHIGIQFTSDENGHISELAYSSSGMNVTTEDYNWIFENFATTSDEDRTTAEGLYEDESNVYMLCLSDSALTDFVCSESEEDQFTNRSKFNYRCESAKNLFEMMAQEKAVLRIEAASASPNTAGHGMVYLGMKNKVTMRMSCAMAMAFPGTVLKKLPKHSAHPERVEGIPDEILEQNLVAFMWTLADQHAAEVKKASNAGDDRSDEDIDSCLIPDDDPCDDLEDPFCDDLENPFCDDELDSLELEDIENDCEEEPAAEPAEEAQENQDYLAMLDDLIGLDDVKEQVRKITAYARMQKAMKSEDRDVPPVVLNMEFVGNPGTAKTTVARIIAGIFYQVGLLQSPDLIEAGRADLIGMYIGHTAVQVRKLFKKAKGKVLFIDEAYSLVDDRRGSYGDEAISTIVQEMENNRGATIVIFAGYPDKMENLFSINPGLRSRVPFKIDFKDYTASELIDISEFEAKKRGFTLSPSALGKVTSILELATQSPDSGNGRLCRNLIDSAVLSYAVRVYGVTDAPAASDEDPDERESDFILEAEDFTVPIGLGGRKKIAMGFH